MPRPTLHLTPRECDVLRGIIRGKTNREIAKELGLKEQGVKNILSAVYEKCDVRNRLELMIYAVRHELLSR
jgi:DNA-binding NarL/FixJ family response regulator